MSVDVITFTHVVQFYCIFIEFVYKSLSFPTLKAALQLDVFFSLSCSKMFYLF